MAHRSQRLHRVARWALPWMISCPLYLGATPASYTDQVPGEAALWVTPYGLSHWLTERAPVGDTAWLVTGVGFGYRVGQLRLAWRLDLHQDPGGDRPLRFLSGEFVSVEQVYRVDAAVRPFWRLALGFGLDLQGVGDQLGLGDDGYFSASNGAAAGMTVAHGWGVDAFVFGDQLFVRAEGTLRAHMGAGRNGLVASAQLGVGWAWPVAPAHPRPRAPEVSEPGAVDRAPDQPRGPDDTVPPPAGPTDPTPTSEAP